MVTITNGTQTLTVTKGAYSSMYAPQGWKRIDQITNREDDFRTISENKEIILPESEEQNFDEETESNEDEIIGDEEDEKGLSEIPLSEMSVPQLKLYAKQLGVNVNTDSARQLRSQIRKVLEG